MKSIDVWRIVTIPEAAKRASVTKDQLRQYVVRYDDFPEPFLVLGKNIRLYDYLAIQKWLEKYAPYGYKSMTEATRARLVEAAREQHLRRRGLLGTAIEEIGDQSEQGERQSESDPERGDEQRETEDDHEPGIAV